MNKKSLALNVVLWFVALPLAARLISAFTINRINEDHHQYNAIVVYLYYSIFVVWACIIFKRFIYKSDNGTLKNIAIFAVYFGLMGLGALFVMVASFWIVAIASGTAP